MLVPLLVGCMTAHEVTIEDWPAYWTGSMYGSIEEVLHSIMYTVAFTMLISS